MAKSPSQKDEENTDGDEYMKWIGKENDTNVEDGTTKDDGDEEEKDASSSYEISADDFELYLNLSNLAKPSQWKQYGAVMESIEVRGINVADFFRQFIKSDLSLELACFSEGDFKSVCLFGALKGRRAGGGDDNPSERMGGRDKGDEDGNNAQGD